MHLESQFKLMCKSRMLGNLSRPPGSKLTVNGPSRDFNRNHFRSDGRRIQQLHTHPLLACLPLPDHPDGREVGCVRPRVPEPGHQIDHADPQGRRAGQGHEGEGEEREAETHGPNVE